MGMLWLFFGLQKVYVLRVCALCIVVAFFSLIHNGSNIQKQYLSIFRQYTECSQSVLKRHLLSNVEPPKGIYLVIMIVNIEFKLWHTYENDLLDLRIRANFKANNEKINWRIWTWIFRLNVKNLTVQFLNWLVDPESFVRR